MTTGCCWCDPAVELTFCKASPTVVARAPGLLPLRGGETTLLLPLGFFKSELGAVALSLGGDVLCDGCCCCCLWTTGEAVKGLARWEEEGGVRLF